MTAGAGEGNQPPELSLVLACYNEENIIEGRVRRIFEVLDALRFSSEVIFVDDGSRDGTSRLIDRILIAHPDRDLRKIEHVHNTGRGSAVADGIRAARGGFAGFIDLDLEVRPSYILPCLLALAQGADVATAHRIYKVRLGSLHRHVMSRGYNVLVRWQTSVPLMDTETGFKFFRRDRILPILDEVQDQGWFWDTEIMARSYLAELRLVEIPALYERSTRQAIVGEAVARFLAAIRQAPPVWPRHFRQERCGQVKALGEVGLRRALRFVWTRFLLAVFRIVPLPPLRSIFLRLCGATVGADTILHRFTLINVDRGGFAALRIGRKCFVGDEVLIDLAAPVLLGDHVTLAARAIVLTHLNVGYKDHPLMARFPARTEGVTIERGCFVGAAAIILPGCNIGPEAFVAAAAVVNRDVVHREVVAGVPIRSIEGGST